MKATGIMAQAYAVAKGEKQLSDLRPAAQAQVKRIFDSYGGMEEVKGFATYKQPEVKIGRRSTMFRKVR